MYEMGAAKETKVAQNIYANTEQNIVNTKYVLSGSKLVVVIEPY